MDGGAAPSNSARPTLADYGERRLVAELLRDRYNKSGQFGDDCAVLPGDMSGVFEIVATTDPCPEPLVASLGYGDLYYQGWLLATINFSDLAAAGAEPLGLLVSYLLPPALAVDDLVRLLDGVDECCIWHGSQVVGGNIGNSQSVQLTGTAIGRCPAGQRLGRGGARPGDRLLLVGSPGYLWGAALIESGHALLPDAERREVLDRALRPVAQLAAGRALAAGGLAHAAVDVSDGLYASVEALCAASHVGAVVEPERCTLDALPAKICSQAGIEPFALAQLWGDWPLVAAVDPSNADRALDHLAEIGVSGQDIGFFVAGQKSCLRQGDRLQEWAGADAERFSDSSWDSGKLPGYLDRILSS
jgi:thiamine-monophosphate kinase